MKKIFTLFVAALVSASMYAGLVQQDLSMNASDWGWGYNSQVINDGNMLHCTLTGEWGALSTGWDPTTDLSGWDKIIFVVTNMSGCDGEYFKLKAYLRDYTESETNQMEGLLGLDALDNDTNYLVIDLHQNKPCDITKARILAVQCQPNGAEFKISRVYLEKEALFDMTYEDKWLKIAPADTTKQYFVFSEDKEFYEGGGRGANYTQEPLQFDTDQAISYCTQHNLMSSMTFTGNAQINPKTHMALYEETAVEGMEYVFMVCYIADGVRSSYVEYIIFNYAGEPSAIEQVSADVKAVKVVRDGQVYILRGDKTFNLLGAEVK